LPNRDRWAEFHVNGSPAHLDEALLSYKSLILFEPPFAQKTHFVVHRFLTHEDGQGKQAKGERSEHDDEREGT
jgi:hypothetical protein